MSREGALAAAERLAAAAHLTGSLEYLFGGRGSRSDGLDAGAREAASTGRGPTWPRKLGERTSTEGLHSVRVLAAAVLVAPSAGWQRTLANVLVTGCACWLHRRRRYGTDGADQMSALVQASCALARAGHRDPRLVDACLLFQATQATMAYVVSGCAKLAGPTWRRGTALEGILRTRVYGDRHAFAWCRRHPRTARWVARSTAIAECGFLGVFVRRGRWAPAIVALACAFHAATARVMGLGRFWWAFTATYPAVLYVARAERRGDVLCTA
ncbi:hypothetical protein FHR84_003267 [Actinopolyspora biskrensis]|uniref:HTTM domain-containing protein n=1 Tax=Actinopolyspora biskrensis TaxID=1470178 RepID=A0A852Z0B3_9ACTN|nr:hypothetical protein [Actinopolyspora biskrensis]NYH79918.1 hypothetical protein [Actinopolyspora biskrensis]